MRAGSSAAEDHSPNPSTHLAIAAHALHAAVASLAAACKLWEGWAGGDVIGNGRHR